MPTLALACGFLKAVRVRAQKLCAGAFAALIFCAPLVALTARITAVVSAADSQPRVAVGGLGTIYGDNLAGGNFSAPGTPWPAKLGDTEVWICDSPVVAELCVFAGLTYAGPTQVNFFVPATVNATTNHAIVIRRNGEPGTSLSASAQSFPFQFDAAAPRIFFMGYDCFIDSRYPDANRNCGLSSTRPLPQSPARGAVTDLQGRVLTSSNPARVGQFYTIWMTGLGSIVNGVPSAAFRLLLTNAPLNASPAGLTQSYAITPSFIGPSAQFPGLYQVNFLLPTRVVDGSGATVDGRAGPQPPYACGDYNWEVQMEIQQTDGTSGVTMNANVVSVPIAVHNGDVPNCAK
jgi:uncharacterized protein (TIGR03437 family)